MLDQFLDWLTGLPSPVTYAILATMSAVENVFPPVPADVSLVLGAFLSRRGRTSVVVLWTLCWLANTASSTAMYFYARRHGRRFFEQGWPRRFMPPSAIAVLESAYERHGVVGIFVSRFLPGARVAVTPFAGVVGMDPVRALVPAALATGIWYVMLIALGSFLGLNWEAARASVDTMNRVLGAVSVLVTLAIVWWIWRQAVAREKQQEREAGSEGAGLS